MAVFVAPIDDYLFLLHDFLQVDRSDLPGFDVLSPDLARPVLEGAASFFEDVLFPLNASGDIEGARLIDGQVRTPAGFKEAYSDYCADGWNRAGIDEAIGGLGLPPVMSNFINEMSAAANIAFTMYAGFTPSAARLLTHFGPAWVSRHIVPRLVSGEWTVTMAMTEAGCGTDLRLMRSRASVDPDGHWRVSGTKIFISAADHDMADNVVHLVLAKIPDADGAYSDTLASVGLFLVSRCEIDPHTGALGAGGAVKVTGVEHKMGLKANATCTLDFEAAPAWPLTPRDKSGDAPGMAGMFYMMNHARFGTGVAAVGLANTAYHSAVHYARERIAGRAPGERRHPERAADALIDQPDVRRLLLNSAAFIEGARAAAAWASVLQSIAADGGDTDERKEAETLLPLLTPVFKAFFTDRAFTATNDCLQVFGGHGYIRDHGMEQGVRDARVLQIYEGANGVQAWDLVRQIRSGKRTAARTLLVRLEQSEGAEAGDPAMQPYLRTFATVVAHLRETLDWLVSDEASPEAAAAVAYDVMTQMGITILAWIWVRTARTALTRLAQDPAGKALYERKIALARIWLDQEGPISAALSMRVRRGGEAALSALDSRLAPTSDDGVMENARGAG